MNYRFLLLFTCLTFGTFPLYAARSISTDLTPFVGYRQDNVKWKTNTGASFQWKNLKFIDYGIKAKTSFRDRLYLIYDLGLANLLSGRFQDNGYLIPGGPSTTNTIKGTGFALRPNVGIGYKFNPRRWFSISPQTGYTYNLLYIKNNRTAGPFSSIKDTMQWHDLWIGFDSAIKARRFSFLFGAAYYYTFFRAKGNWKLPPTNTSNNFTQSGNGRGVKGRIGLGYQVFNSVNIGVENEI